MQHATPHNDDQEDRSQLATVLVKSRVHVTAVRLLVCDARVSCASCVLAKTRDLARREHSHAHGVGERVRPNRKEAAI
jgi:hypothetical protein